MGSDENKFSKPSERKLCANGCGFFGTAATMNLCSKCYRDLRVTGEQAASAKAAKDKLVNPNPVLFSLDSSSAVESPPVVDSVAPVAAKAANRCSSCNKKVGVMGFKCRCGSTFCGAHRYPEKHECSFDFKGSGRDAIAHANPVVKADKVKRF